MDAHAPHIDALDDDAAWRATQRRLAWRRRLLPLVGAGSLLFVWWALIIQATYNFDAALLYATVLCGSFFSVSFFLVIRLIERAVVRWDAAAA